MIGLFDSGYGGLTILRALVDHLPQYSYIYLGDNARAPYGDRTPQEIFEFTRQGVAYLFERGSVIVILACNTASAIALRRLQQEWLPQNYPDGRILGILVPTVEQVTGVPWKTNKASLSALLGKTTVGILATEQTVRSGAYKREITRRNPSLHVIQQACPALVQAIEGGESDEKISQLVQKYVFELQEKASGGLPPLSAVLLGCTHFELIADAIRQHLPSPVRLYKQPAIVAASLRKYLKIHPELAHRIEHRSRRVLITTGDPVFVSAQGQRYFKQSTNFTEKSVLR